MGQLKNLHYNKKGLFVCLEESKTKQSMAEECDINFIVGRFLQTGALPNAANPPQYGDVSALPNLQEAMNQVREAQTLFMKLPAQIRAEINHDSTKLEAWLSDPRNLETARTLGVVAPAPKPPDAPLPLAAPPQGAKNPPPKGGSEPTP